MFYLRDLHVCVQMWLPGLLGVIILFCRITERKSICLSLYAFIVCYRRISILEEPSSMSVALHSWVRIHVYLVIFRYENLSIWIPQNLEFNQIKWTVTVDTLLIVTFDGLSAEMSMCSWLVSHDTLYGNHWFSVLLKHSAIIYMSALFLSSVLPEDTKFTSVRIFGIRI